jgi:hypothetical protein
MDALAINYMAKEPDGLLVEIAFGQLDFETCTRQSLEDCGKLVMMFGLLNSAGNYW